MKKLFFLAVCAVFFSNVAMAQWPQQQQTTPPPPPRPTGIAGLDFWQNVDPVPSFVDLENTMRPGQTFIKRDVMGYVFSPPTTRDSNGAQVNPNGRITVWINQHNPNTGRVTPVPVSCEIFQSPNSWDTPEFRNVSRDNPLPVSLIMSCTVQTEYTTGAPLLKRFISAHF